MTSDGIEEVDELLQDDESDPREPIHALNGRLLLGLQALIPEVTWNEWIVNVIMLHRSVGAVETVTLETSATWYLGEQFFSRDDCLNRGRDKVMNLDGHVPMNDSFAGYCLREGNVIWVDNLSKTKRPPEHERGTTPLVAEPDPLKEKYRSFAYVGVKTPRPARSEYVFPIRLRIGLSGALLGVLNCEWYGQADASVNTFEVAGQTRIEHLVTHILNVHARFLPLAFDHMQTTFTNWNDFLERYYQPCLDQHIARIRKGAPV